jgi:hypothetical protein
MDFFDKVILHSTIDVLIWFTGAIAVKFEVLRLEGTTYGNA